MISLYDITVPVFERGLANLSAMLEKGRAHAEAAGIAAEELLTARLAPDMLPLTGQVQRASDTAKFAMVRLAGVVNERFVDEEASFAELVDRVARTQAFLAAVPRSALEGKEADRISATIGTTPVSLSATSYALRFAVPNFHFHVTTAYDLLRWCGVPVGKADYLGPMA